MLEQKYHYILVETWSLGQNVNPLWLEVCFVRCTDIQDGQGNSIMSFHFLCCLNGTINLMNAEFIVPIFTTFWDVSPFLLFCKRIDGYGSED